MGYSSTLNGCYSNTQGNLRSAPFTFRKRLERIDWRKIASLDIDQISRDLDFQALQDNVGNVAFCNIECEIDPRCCDPNYIKLFRLAQLIIEYLLHSQDYLSHSMVALEGKCQELNAELAREKKNRQMLDENLKASGEETKKYKKLYCAQRENQNTGTNCHTCPFCPKMFMTVEYLQMHLKRRHLTASPRTAPPPHDVNTQGLGWEKLEEEIKALRHSLELKEKQLQDEQDIRDEMLHKEMEMWKRDQLLGHKKEIEAIRESFITEVKELCRRATNAELGIDCLQKQLNSTLSKPLSPTIYQKEDGVEMLKEQKKEFCKLRKHLTELVESVVCQQLKDQEELLQRKVKVILKEQNHELGKLNSLMQEKMIQNETSTNDDLLLTLCEKTKVQEKLLRQQQKQLQKLYCEQKKHQQMQVQQQQQQQQLKELQQQQQQQQQLQQLQQFLPSPNREAKPKERTKRLHRSDTTADRSSDSKDKSSRLAEALQKNPSLVQGLRDEISCMLQEKLEMHGIRPVDQSISKAILKEKLVDLEQERKSMFQKYPDYKKLRKHYEKHLNTIAAEYKHRYEQESRSSLQNSVSGNWKSESSLDNLEEPEKILENLSEIIKKHIENKPQRRHSLPRRAESFLTSPENTSSHVKSSPLQGTKLSLQKIFSQVKNKLSPKKPWKKPLRTTSSPQISVGEKSTTNNNPIEELKVASHLMGNEKTVVIEDEEEEEEEDDDDGYEYDTEDDKSVSDTDVNDKPNQTKTMYPSLPSTSQGKGVIIDESEDEVSHTDWDSASELEEMKDTTPIKIQKVESSPNLSALIREKRQGSDNVTKLSQSIEKQLSAPRVKPFGGVSVLPDVNKSSTEKTKSKMIPEEKIEDLSLSSFSDDNNSKINYKKSPVKLLAKESSSSPQVIIPGKSDMQPTANKLDGKEKIIKPPLKIALSSWDSDEDLSEIT